MAGVIPEAPVVFNHDRDAAQRPRVGIEPVGVRPTQAIIKADGSLNGRPCRLSHKTPLAYGARLGGRPPYIRGPNTELEALERDRGRVQVGRLVVGDAKVLLEIGPVDMPVSVETLRNTEDVAGLELVSLARFPVGDRYRTLNDVDLLVPPESLPGELTLTRLSVTTRRIGVRTPQARKQGVGA